MLIGGGGVTLGMYFLFNSVIDVMPNGFMLAAFLMAIAFHALLIIAFVFDMAATMNIFFLSSDLSLLMSAPISTVKVFAVKYVDALISSSLIMVIFGIPLMIAFGIAVGAPPTYYILLIPIAYIFLSIPVSIGILMGIVISRYVAPRRVKEVLAFVGTLMGIGFWLTTQLLRRSILAGDQIPGITTLSAFMDTYFNHPIVRMLPSQLASSSLTHLATAANLAGLRPILGLMAMAGGLLVISVLLAGRMYLTGWARAGSAVSKPRLTRQRWIPDYFTRLLPAFERATARVTLRMFLRDPQQLAPLVSITVIIMLIPFLSGFPSGRLARSPLIALQSVAALAFIGSLNVASSATVIDGKCFWMFLAAPFSALRKTLSKVLAALFLFLPIVFAISIAFGTTGLAPRSDMVKLILVGLALGTAGASIGVFIGVSYGNWEWEIPKRMLRTKGRVIMTVILAAFFGSISITSTALARHRPDADLGWVTIALAILAALILTLVFVGLSSRKIRHMEWTM